ETARSSQTWLDAAKIVPYTVGMGVDVHDLLLAFDVVKSAWWPTLNCVDLNQAIASTESHQSGVRVFWKDTESVYLGCNSLFARDAGLPTPESIVGLSDLDRQIAWGGNTQAFAFRRDDRDVMTSAIPKLDILERQKQADGDIKWLQTSKAPILAHGEVVGLIGMYEVISAFEAAKRGIS
ncbi:MAG: PAS domain-containing protein, partial [Myxococcota bacterium]